MLLQINIFVCTLSAIQSFLDGLKLNKMGEFLGSKQFLISTNQCYFSIIDIVYIIMRNVELATSLQVFI